MKYKQTLVVMMAAMMFAMTGATRAAEVPVPAEAINEDVPVAVWIDLEALDIDAILSSVQSIANVLPEDMAEQREPMVAEAGNNLEEIRHLVSTLREGGARGMLFVVSGSDMEQQEAMGLVYTTDEASVESMQAAIRKVNQIEAGEGAVEDEADGGAEVQAYSGNWMRIIDGNTVEIRDGDEANAAAFRELLNASGDAPIRVALRLTDDIKQEIAAQANADPMMAGFAGALQSLDTGWTTVSFGEQPEIANRLNFGDAEAAAEFNAAWEGMLMMGEAMIMGQLAQMPNAPEPETVQRLFESLKMEQEDGSLSLTLGDQFIGQAAEFAPAAMGMFMMMMMNNAMQDADVQWEQEQWEEPAQAPDENGGQQLD